MDPQELVPLEAAFPRTQANRHCSIAARSCYRGPIRICRLFALLIFLPSVFVIVPLYMRYRVFSGQMYPMSMSDMRLIDSKISTTWCQGQVVKSNTTFNAFVVPGPPEMQDELVPVSMTRQLVLEDDMKEYWGFYLLKGSTVTVSTCCSRPGASLIMIKGYKHLQQCAYIGDNSSEELEELQKAYDLGLISKKLLNEKILGKVDGKANDPETMKRHKAGVSFHDPSHVTNYTSPDTVPTVDVTDHDPKELREILELLHTRRQAAKDEALKHYQPPPNLMALPGMHRHRDTNVARDEREFLSFKNIDGNISEHDKKVIQRLPADPPTAPEESPTVRPKLELVTEDNFNKNESLKEVTEDSKTESLKKETEIAHNKLDNLNGMREIANKVGENTNKVETVKDEAKEVIAEENNLNGDKVTHNDERLKEVETQYTGTAGIRTPQVSLEEDSKEVFEDVLKRLQALGGRGKRVLAKLHETMGGDVSSEKKLDIMAAVTGSEEELDKLRKVLVEAIDEEKTRTQRKQKRRDAREEARAKRELMLGQIELQKQLNEDDEARDYAAEEGLTPDGVAEHHEQINETDPFDMSNSEFWSSFSSSEEALLECEGLILNLPLTPSTSCVASASDNEAFSAARPNALTYRVPSNGYYFFVFNSENEVHPNFIRARFDLQKTRYDVARSALRECKNSTEKCNLSLDIFSSQKVVLEVPLSNNDSLWNEQFVITSECEPRTSLYLVCVIAVPIIIMLFAFQ